MRYSHLRNWDLRGPSPDVAGEMRDFRTNRDILMGFGFVVFLMVAALVVISSVGESHYVASGQAASDAVDYGCASGTAESARCRTCSSPLGVCCDLRCADPSGGRDVRLRCRSGQGCTLAPEVEVTFVSDPGMPSSQVGTLTR